MNELMPSSSIVESLAHDNSSPSLLLPTPQKICHTADDDSILDSRRSKSSRNWLTVQPTKEVALYKENTKLKRKRFFVQRIFILLLHGVWKSQKMSHSTLRAKRATFTFWVHKKSLKIQMRHFEWFSNDVKTDTILCCRKWTFPF